MIRHGRVRAAGFDAFSIACVLVLGACESGGDAETSTATTGASPLVLICDLPVIDTPPAAPGPNDRFGIVAGEDYTLQVTLKGTTVSVALDGQVVLGHAFYAVTVDGGFGLMTLDGTSSFAIVTVSTDDPAYLVQNVDV